MRLISVIKPTSMICAENGAAWADKKSTQNFNRKPEGKSPLGRPRLKRKDNIEVHLKI